MKISSKDWNNYISGQNLIRTKARDLMADWIDKNGIEDRELMIEFANALCTKYGESAAAYACKMYDEIAESAGANVAAAVPANTATLDETAKAINGCMKQSPTGRLIPGVVERQVKQAGADTILHNAARDEAFYAWVPTGMTCAFCLMIGSNGFKKASKKLLRNHAEHIHANCDCDFVVSFDPFMEIEGYDPNALQEKYNSFNGSSNDKMKAWRNELREFNKEKINEQKREIYAQRKLEEGLGQNKKDHKVTITDVAIEKVNKVSIPGYSEEELLMIQDMNKDILRNARNNQNNEVAMIIDKNWKVSKPVFGDEYGVEILKDTEMQVALSTSPFRSIVLSHNHPSLSYFSADDIGIFIQFPSIKTMEVVTNNGKTWYISKNNKYDDLKALKKYQDIINENPDAKHDVIVEKFLKVMYSFIERNG